MASELSMLVREWGLGTSVQLHIGGAPLVGTNLVEAVGLVQGDPLTKVTVVFGEPSGRLELDLAGEIESGRLALPVIALVAGRFADRLPASLPFGHAPRAGVGGDATVEGKMARLEAVGASVVTSLDELQRQLVDAVGRAA